MAPRLSGKDGEPARGVERAPASESLARPERSGAASHVLVTDVQERSAVAAIRCLADAGHSVTGTAPAWGAPGFWSRHCHTRRRLPDPRVHLRGFLDGLERLVAPGHLHLLMAGTDASLFAVSRHRRRLEPHVLLALPEHVVVERCLSKTDLYESAAEVGLAPPDTVLCRNAESAARAARSFGFPVAIKPAQVVLELDDRLLRQGSRMVQGERALSAALKGPGPWLVQRRVEGSLHSVAGVAVEDGLLAVVASRYRRLWPPTSGDGSFLETVPVSAELRTQVERLLELLGWRGVFQLELIEHDGRLAALDFNPRPYGSMAVAQAAGVPLSDLWCDWALGGRPARVLAPAGIRYRWEDADARFALSHLRNRQWGPAAAALRPQRGVAHAFFRADDPLPLLAQALQLTHRLAARRRQGLDESEPASLLAPVGMGQVADDWSEAV